MQIHKVPASFEEFPLSSAPVMDATVVVPTVRSTWKLKYGEHAYYFMNFKNATGFSVTIRHSDIIRPGIELLKRTLPGYGRPLFKLRSLFRSYHYGFRLHEQIMLMTVPHTVTDIGKGRYLINLWSYVGYLLIDCCRKKATYHILEDTNANHVLGSRQWFDHGSGELYAMSYSLADSFGRIQDPARTVSARIFRHKPGSDEKFEVWNGRMADYMHDIQVNKTRQYCVTCELGMYLDRENNIIPSKVLIIDLTSGEQWVLDRFIVAAHAQFDPELPDVIYFSNHNFEFVHTPLRKLLAQGSYSVKFRGPASIYKYRLTSDGPQEIGVFTRSDFFRLTNMHAFNCHGRTIIAAMGFPDEIFIIDAENMSFIKKITIQDPAVLGRTTNVKKAMIGTITPEPNGTRLFVQTARSFQAVDIESGRPDFIRGCAQHHTCANHMFASTHTDWDTTGRGRP